MVNYKITDNQKLNSEILILGLPDHINQLGTIRYNDQDLTQRIDQYRHQHLISSNLGKVSSTLLPLQEKSIRLITVGLGNLKSLDYAALLKVFGYLFQFLKESNITEADILFDTFISKQVPQSKIAEVMGLQSEQAIYTFDNYKSNKPVPYQLDLVISTENKQLESNIQEGVVVGQAINLARDYSNIPPNILTPNYFAEQIEQHFVQTSVEVDIKDGSQLLAEGFGLIHAVGKGSEHPPTVITMTYNGGKKEDAPIALVGKGITYDSGGYSIKSKVGMQTMKFDMCGAANVVGMIEAAARLELPINIVGVIASAENMISSNAMKPDDVFTALSGETVEMLNSDAEGRLVLGDAVFYANQFQPSIILDFATLTGAAIVALGEDKAAIFSSHVENEIQDILASARETDEFAFELPITRTEQRLIRNSNVADLVNHTNGNGKALFAATFITHFSGQTPHIHFDIAGPATTNKNSYKGPKGPTGSMIVPVLNWLRS
ncbi:leucyl aminopeptidase family protein [Staphylococcus taiwanensis]|nr:leucyl aminopeptidase family protein [Staphylococcus taiwanensis]